MRNAHRANPGLQSALSDPLGDPKCPFIVSEMFQGVVYQVCAELGTEVQRVCGTRDQHWATDFAQY